MYDNIPPDVKKFDAVRTRKDRIGPSTTGLPTCVHRGGWWVKVDVICKLLSGWAGAL